MSWVALSLPAMIAALAVAGVPHAFAAEFILKDAVSGTSFDWRDGTNYTGGTAPSAGDFVQIPDGVTARLSSGDAWWDFVSALGRIRPMSATSYFQVDVSETETRALSCEVTCTAANEKASMDKGGLVKTGLGCLDLAVGKYTHFTRLSAAAGRLRLKGAADQSKCYFDNLNVASNAVLELMTAKSIVCHTFSGEGEITTDEGATLQTISSDRTFVFDGRLTGSVKLYALNTILLTATNSTSTGALNVVTPVDVAEAGGTSLLGLARFGKKKETGSVGNPSTWTLGSADGGAGGFLYLGTGETADRDFSLKATVGGPLVFDGGAAGGLALEGGRVTIDSKAAALNHRIVLCGSNQTACVFADRLVERLDGGDVRIAYHLLKRGSGTWRLSDASYTATELPWSGAVSVEEGVLQFDSLAAAGTLCSLGTAENRYSAYTGVPDESRRVPWAMSLGTPTTAGTLEYVGTEDVDCRTRPIILKGDGTLANSTTNAFRFSGVGAESGTTPTLTLSGTGKDGNILDGITDTDQDRLSIAKAGSGTWTLSTNVAFHGALDVCEGRLNVNAGTRYTWFRFTVTENYGDMEKAAAATFCVRKLAFFDKDGMDQTVGLSFANDYRALQPGQFAYGKDYTTKSGKTYPYCSDAYPWDKLFEDADSYPSVTLAAVPTAGEPSTAFPLVIRLPEGANPIASFDICYNTSATGYGRVNQPKAFTLEGSTDGLSWTPLFSRSGITSPGSGYWLQSGKIITKTLPLATTPYVDGDTVSAPPVRPTPLDSVSQVAVAAGATLAVESGRATVDSLKLDIVNGMGTVKGVDFAAAGTVELVGEYGHEVPSATLIDCTGFSNVSNWTVMRGGKIVSASVVTTDDGKITVHRPGLILILK